MTTLPATPEPCYCCGKLITRPRYFVETIDGGSVIRRQSDPPADENDPGYCGWHPVGIACARRLRAESYGVLEFVG